MRMICDLIRNPDVVTVLTDSGKVTDTEVTFTKVEVSSDSSEKGLCIQVRATEDAVTFIRLRWQERMDAPGQILTDDWERSYGTLEWRGFVPERKLPWYFLMNTPEGVFCAGVLVRPSALCYWQVDPKGVTLVLDVRNGGMGVKLCGRVLEAATVVSAWYPEISPFEAGKRFCGVMCKDPILPKSPVYGSNNWYYAYGKSSEREILEDTTYLAELTAGLSNRPFMVIDDGWQMNDCTGPWYTGNDRFPDMKGLASKMREEGVKPGIWLRLLADRSRRLSKDWVLRTDAGGDVSLDPSHPHVLSYTAENIARLHDWGYELIKHDFSVYDTIGHFSNNMPTTLVKPGWHFYDRSKTTAEIIKEFYRVILESSGGALILGCCVMDHLCAGYVHINRTGNDTSGQYWEKTRFCGVNAMAFKLFQHNQFYAVDADCAGLTEFVPWEKNAQWLDLLAKSGTVFFVSSKKGVLNERQKDILREAYARASVQTDTLEPLDWLTCTTPGRWLVNGEEVCYNWYEDGGISGISM